MKKRVGLVGLGLMGHPMGENWLKKGFELTILPHKNLTNARALEKAGARVAAGVSALVENSDVIILMLPTSREVEELTLGQALSGSLNSEHLVVDMSTSDPASTRRIHKTYSDRGLRFMDAPVTGGVTGAQAGTLTLFVGGPAAWHEEAREVLAAVSQRQTHFGEASLGHVAKLVNNFICIGNLAVFSEALPLAVRSGLEPEKIFSTLLSGTASSRMLETYGPQILQGDFEPRFKLAHAFKDMGLAQKLAEDCGLSLSVLKGILEDFKLASREGLEERNLSALIKPIEKMAGASFRK